MNHVVKQAVLGALAIGSTSLAVFFYVDYVGYMNTLDKSAQGIFSSPTYSQIASPAAAGLEKVLFQAENPQLSDALVDKQLQAAPNPRGKIEVEGEAIVIWKETFNESEGGSRDRVEKEIFVRDKETKKVFELDVDPDEVDEAVLTDTVVKVKGDVRSNIIDVDVDRIDGEDVADVEVLAQPEVAGASAPTTAQAAYKILVIPANFTDRNVQCSVADLEAKYFSDSSFSLDDATIEASNNRLGVEGVVLEPTTIPFSSSQSDYWNWSAALREYATNQGYDVNDFNSISYVLPTNGTGNTGLGYECGIGSSGCSNWIFRCDNRLIIQHEIGHNMGMSHAASLSSEYGDRSDPMGDWRTHFDDFNAPHKEKMGWVQGQNVVTNADGNYTLDSLDIPDSSVSNPQVLRVPMPVPVRTNEEYYISYRTRDGLSGSLNGNYVNKISIHRAIPGVSWGLTYILDTLNPGETFTDSAGPVNITFNSINGSSANVTVDQSGTTACVQSDETVSVSPTSATREPGQSQMYTVRITNNDTSACPDETYNVRAALHTLPSGWSAPHQSVTIGPGEEKSTIVFAVSPSNIADGTYTIPIYVDEAQDGIYGGTRVDVQHTIQSTAVPAPTATLNVSSNSITSGNSATLTWSSANATSCTGSGFSTGNNTSGSVSVSPTSNTTYTVTCTGSGGSANDSEVVAVIPQLSASASSDVTSGDAPLAVQFTGGATGGTGSYSYSWNFGDGQTSTSQSPSHTYSSAGTYSAVLTVTSGSQTDTSTVSVSVSTTPSPVVTLSTGDSSIISGDSTTLTWDSTFATSCTGTGFDTGDAVSGALTVSPTSNTTYTVTCTGAGGSDSESATVTVIPVLAASVSASRTSGDRPLSVRFVGGATGGTGSYSYSWNFGDGQTSTSQSPSHSYNREGTFNAVLTVTSGSQTDTSTVVIAVSTPPAPTVSLSSGQTSIISGDSTTLTWSSGNASGCTGSGFTTGNNISGSASISPTSDTTYTVTCTGDGGSNSESVTVDVIPALTASASVNRSSGDAPFAVQFTGGASGGTGSYTYVWNFGDGGSSNAQSPSYTYRSVGSFTATLTVVSGTQTTTSNVGITTSQPIPEPTATLNVQDVSITSGDSTTLTWNSTDATRCTGNRFNTGDRTSGSVSVSPTSNTTYTLSCTGAGGSASDTASVTVTAPPVAQQPPVIQQPPADQSQDTKISTVTVRPKFEGKETVAGESLTIAVYNPGENDELETLDGNANSSGEVSVENLDIDKKTYDIEVRKPGYRTVRVRNVDLTKEIDLPELDAGDLNDDGSINLVDFAIMGVRWFTGDTTADYNGDGVVNSLDFSLMSKNFGT